MPIEFDNLGDLWGSIADGFSGRTSVVLVPPQTTNYWLLGVPLTSTVRLIDKIVVTLETPTGPLDLECPPPTDSMAGFRTVNSIPNFRRCVLYSSDSAIGFGSFGEGNNAKTEIIDAVWPSLIISDTHGTFAFSFNIGQPTNLKARIGLLQVWVSENVAPGITILGPGISTLDTAPDVVGSYSGVIYLTADNAGVPINCSPSDPDEQEYLATVLSYPATQIIEVSGPDINALNNLWDAMAEGPGVSGALETHRGRTLAEISSGSTVLPKATGTSDDMMHRGADAVRAWLGGSLVLHTQRPSAVVAANRGYLKKVI